MFGSVPSNYKEGQTLGEYIRASRTECGLSLRKFAKILDVSASYWSDVERDNRKITKERVSQLAWELSQRLPRGQEEYDDELDDDMAWLIMYHHLLSLSGLMSKELKALLKIIGTVYAKGKRRYKLEAIREIILEVFFCYNIKGNRG